jgi:hypothetical protein
MAVIGGSAGYATVEGPQRNYVGEAMANVENSGFKYREEQNALNEMKKKEERILRQDRDDELKDALAFDQKYRVSDTGIQSVDTKIHDVALKLKQLYAQANQDYRSAKTNAEKTAAYQKMSNSMGGLSTMKQFPDAYNASTEALAKGLSEGIYSDASSKRKAAELDKFANGQYVVDVDDRGNILFSTFDMDNGQVSKVKSKDLTAQQMLQNFNPTKAFNIDGTGTGTKKGDSLIKIYNDNIGKERKVIEGTGLNAKEKTYNPGAEELAKTMAIEAVQDKDKLYEIFDRIGVDPENPNSYNSPEKIALAAKYLEDKLIASAPTTISNKPDTSIEQLNISKANAAETRKNNAIDNALNREKFNQDILEKDKVTVGTTEYKFTPIGEKAKKEFFAKPENKGKNMTGEDWPAGSFKVIRTSVKVSPDKGKKQPAAKTYSKVQETAIETAMKNNPGYSRQEIIKALKL